MSSDRPTPGLEVDALRGREFPHIGESAYLNAASVTPLPERARRAAQEYNDRRARIHGFGESDFVDPPRTARLAAARLIGADPEEIALGWNTSFGINLAALSLPIEPGTTVVTSDREFPANVYPWTAREGLRLELVPTRPDGTPDEARILERLDRGDVSILSISAVQFTNGYRVDLERFGAVCRERGIHFVVDAIQSLGQVPMDVRAAGVDVLATGGHKWLLSPFGTGFCYVRRELIERMEPRVVGWTGMTASADLEDLLDYRWEWKPDARRFEVATLPFQDLAAMAKSLELLLEVGVEAIERHLREVLAPLEDWLRARPSVERLGPADESRSAIVAFRTGAPERVFAALERAGVVCAMREGALRIAPHLYNTRSEIERVVEVLEEEVPA